MPGEPCGEPRVTQLVQDWLAAEGGAGSSSTDLAATVERVLVRLIGRLGSVLGEGGVRAILARSAHVLRADHASLSGLSVDGPDLLGTLVSRLRELPRPAGLEASLALFTTFVRVLASLIGEPLTFRLLRDIWPPDADSADSEEAL